MITSYDHTYNTERTNDVCLKIARSFINKVSHEATRSELGRILAHSDYSALCNFRVDYDSLVAAPVDAAYVRSALALFQKRDDLELGINREEVAFQGFLAAEVRCFETNNFFKMLRRGLVQTTPRVAAWMFQAQRKIAQILGDCPTFEQLPIHYGPGSTTQVKRRIAHPRVKLGSKLACSSNLSKHINLVLEELPHLIPFGDSDVAAVEVEIHPSRLEFVPKNYKTYRTINVEPGLNTMCQLGIGSIMSERLRSHGIDLRDQSANQRAARQGSIDGSLATLDLSSASDTIATELVYSLLPIDWAELLASVRTQHAFYVKGGVEYTFEMEKFSSMGNGFTFPLQSIIFYALALAVCPEPSEKAKVLVYGDDIIIPSNRYQDLVTLLTVCGFSVNLEKSFASGPFRESCGADYLLGYPIRPAYLKTRLSGEAAFVLHNAYKRRGYEDEASIILDLIPEHVRLFGPDGYGDGHLLGDHELEPVRKHGFGGYTFKTYVSVGRTIKGTLPGDRVLPAYTIYRRGLFSKPTPLDTCRLRYHRHVLRYMAYEFLSISEPEAFRYVRNDLVTVAPGKKGYKVIRIYTFG